MKVMNNAKPSAQPHSRYGGDIIMIPMSVPARFLTSCKKRMHMLLGDRSGLGAVEFALLAPVLVVLYMGAVEITVALSVDTRVSRAGNITLDLITKVAWSWGNEVRRPYATGSTADIPDGLKMPNSFYVRGEIINPHDFISTFPFMGSAQVGALNLNETYYMRPRLGAEIDCTDC